MLHTHIGTSYFKAPELLNMHEVFNYKTDIFAIGVTAYYMIFGYVPFYPFEYIVEILKIGELVFNPKDVKGGLSKYMIEFIMHCLMYKR